MQSTPMKVTEDFLLGPAAAAASPIQSLAPVLPAAHSVVNVAAPTIRSTCAAPGCPLGPHPGEQKMVTLEIDVGPEPNVGEQGVTPETERSE